MPTSNFYADLLGQYRFLDYDVTAPTSTGTVKGGFSRRVGGSGRAFLA